MAIVLLEGFDHYTQHAGSGQLSDKGWAGAGFNMGAGRLPYGAQSQSLNVINLNSVSKTLPYGLTSLIAGFGFNIRNSPSSQFFAIGDGAAGVLVDPTTRLLTLQINGTGTLSGTGTNQVLQDQWNYLELSVTPTSAEVRLNGIVEIPAIHGTYSNTYHNIIFLNNVLGGNSMGVDDVYVIDPTVGINTTYLGDICVETLFPISDGTHTDWTVDIGGLHYPRVAEHILDEDASYVHTTTAGAKDTYGMGDPVLGNTPVFGVQLNLGARKNDAGSRVMAPLIRQSGTDYVGASSAVTADYKFHSQIYDQDPTGANWLYSTVNSDEFGIELVT